MLRVITLNLNGIRSAATKGFLDWLNSQNADVVCLQEIKAQAADLPDTLRHPQGWHTSFHYAEKRGYSGVGILSRHAPNAFTQGLGITEFDAEGRYLQADFEQFGQKLSIISLYLPSGSSSEERQAAKFRFMAQFAPHMQRLRESGREVIICGDWNIAHQAIDLKNWKSNQKNSGFLPEERAWMGERLANGWVDVYRHLYPEATDTCYTWWSNRGQAWAKNVGWRLDYQLATASIAATAQQASVYKDQRFSDHAPLSIDYAIEN